ncbi:hypothetical protein [Cutibacterium sp. V947]|uniref:hypothetical protein n=1 Tax=unclassified Cutibacterium TaxID=2649671 RepID=UPI003EDFD7D6
MPGDVDRRRWFIALVGQVVFVLGVVLDQTRILGPMHNDDREGDSPDTFILAPMATGMVKARG